MTRSVGKLLTLIEHVLLDTTYPTPSNVIDNDNCILGFEIKKLVLNYFALLFASSFTAFENAYKAIKVEIENDLPYLQKSRKIHISILAGKIVHGITIVTVFVPPFGIGTPSWTSSAARGISSSLVGPDGQSTSGTRGSILRQG